MSSVVNLRVARKQKVRADKERLAAENRTLHGRTKAEKRRDELEAQRSAALVEAHRRDPGGKA